MEASMHESSAATHAVIIYRCMHIRFQEILMNGISS